MEQQSLLNDLVTSPRTAVFASFRLGGTDGVSVEAAKWESALTKLGFSCRRVAGEILDAGRSDDVVIPELRMRAAAEPSPALVEAAFEGADLVVIENLLSLPLNLPGARIVSKVLADHPRVVLHHHDLPWQRVEFAHVDELPPLLDGALHVVINELSRRELLDRGIEAHVVRNHFDLAPEPGDRAATRRRLGLGESDILALHPVRAIERKNLPGALALCAALDARLPRNIVHYWLPGPAEDGYEATLESLLDDAERDTRVELVRSPAQPIRDAYAACDLVVFPSTWEGFGNPVIESVAFGRPLAAGDYPALRELTHLGFSFLSSDDPAAVAAVLSGVRDIGPSLERNLELARAHLAIELLPGRIEALMAGAGWSFE
ncbi:MAG TPA: glycosyltransferase [Acidimicrobiia bacterium]|nr:glycosyltransferase [Acidimicrobiia bacterium]